MSGPADDPSWVDEDDTVRTTREPAALPDLLGDLVTRRGWAGRLRGATVFRSWEELVGPELAARTEPVRLAGGVLTVRAENAAWATELNYLAAAVVARAAEVLGPDLVRHVKVTIGTRSG